MAVNQSPGLKVGDPYCSKCGYVLRELTESGRCPECGSPLVDVLLRATGPGSGVRAIRIRSGVEVFGWPLYMVALGPRPEFGETKGVAKGVVAVGDIAIGGVAVGGMAVGGIAFGGMGVGACAFGGLGLGVLTGVGGLGVGGVAVGGAAVGVLATGGGALGYVAQGGGAFGVYARGPGASGVHVIGPGGADPAATAMFAKVAPVMGSFRAGLPNFLTPLMASGGLCIVVLVALGMAVLLGRKTPARRNAAGAR